MKDLLSIILVNYNNSKDTINCLKSLKNQTYQNFEILIIDNNSNDLNKNLIKKFLKKFDLNQAFKKKIKIFFLKNNLGYTGGNNFGIKQSKGNLILLLNSDTVHEKDFLENMVSLFKKHKNLHIAQPKICFFPEKNIIWGNGGEINKFSIYLFSHKDFLKQDIDTTSQPMKIDYATGCALFIRRNILQKIGLLDNIYFMYCEDSDLCYRAYLEGYRNIYCFPNIKIYHKTPIGISSFYKKFFFRNRTIFCFKFLPLILLFWQFIAQIIHLLLSVIDLKRKKLEYKFFITSIKGILNGIKIGIIIRNRKKLNHYIYPQID
ncbi:MAG: glycosyltransferase family 2 protein [Promethearchaeota archaeon]